MIRSTTLTAFRYQSFALFWSAQAISGFGDKITLFALAFVTWQLTRSALSTALAVVISTVPYAIFGFFGGAIADAVGRRRAMVACDLVRMICIAVIPLLLTAGVSLAVVYSLVFVAALCSAVFSPARLALVPDIMPTNGLSVGNSLVYASDRTIEIVGALVAGLLVAALDASAFYVDAATFAISAWLLSRIVLQEAPSGTLSWARLLDDANGGLRVLRDNTYLRVNTVVSLLAQLSLPVVNGLTPVLIFREYRLGPEQYAASEAAIAVGAVVASLVSPGLLSGVRKGRVIIGGFAAFGLVLTLFALSPPFFVLLALFVLVGVTNVIFFVPNMTLIQEQSPVALRGRVFGARIALLNLTWLPVILAVAGLADALPVQTLLAAAGAFSLGVAVVGAFSADARNAP